MRQREEREPDRYYISETDKQAKNGKQISKKASYSRKKREVEIVTARHFEVNESKATTDKERIMERQTFIL